MPEKETTSTSTTSQVAQVAQVYEVFVPPKQPVPIPGPSFQCTQLDAGWTLLRKSPQGITDIPEVCCAVLGNVDAGKSTLLGVLTRGLRDDGRGKARACIFRHPHEIETGRTSSVGQEMTAFDIHGHHLIPASSVNLSSQQQVWEDVFPRAAKVVTFFDLAGHEKYLRTTMFGLAGHGPSYAILIVGANDGGSLIGMTKEHLLLAWSLNLPVILVVTKIDLAPDNVREATVQGIARTIKKLSANRKTPFVIKEHSDALATAANLGSICPILQVSAVNGDGLDLLTTLLNALPLPERLCSSNCGSEPVEFYVNETYSVPGVGTVVSGPLLKGTVKVGQTLYLGPDSLGKFNPVSIKSIHLKRMSITEASAPHIVALALKRTKRNAVRRGSVLLSSPGEAVWEFSADILVLFQHSTTIAHRYQAVVHCGVVRQTAQVVDIEKDNGVMRTGDRARVRFRFTRFPEYLQKGARILFREGRTKGIGKIVDLFPSSN